ncbi:hypothetical protein Acor_14640 [Acrocarpospora corrugata]|uniref:ABC transporter domain-containing protein n=1 Tax=Acrocarpospora corrugata TaxID=35763 RepID=A0A5M3VX95_9ACTN|nr:hypothetical protein Acor_14640 [Acrocarpospora corrugata]
MHGFLGPNGAGKTTTLRVLLGLLRADAGRVRVLGGDHWQDAVELHHRLAYVPGEVNLWPNLSGGEAIDLFGELRGGLDKARRAELLERFRLDPAKRCRTYSKGNRQKVALIAAVASDVELFVLDEPTSGLDPLMEAAFQQTVHEVSGRGATVLLSSRRVPNRGAAGHRPARSRVQPGRPADARHARRHQPRRHGQLPQPRVHAGPGRADEHVRGGTAHQAERGDRTGRADRRQQRRPPRRARRRAGRDVRREPRAGRAPDRLPARRGTARGRGVRVRRGLRR